MLKVIVFLGVICCAVAFLVGGYETADLEDEGVKAAAQHATLALGKQFSTPYHAKLAKIQKAKQQVVAGMNYRLNVIVGLTDCKKKEVDFAEIETCAFQTGPSTYRKCEVVVYRNLDGDHKLVSSGCILASKDEVE